MVDLMPRTNHRVIPGAPGLYAAEIRSVVFGLIADYRPLPAESVTHPPSLCQKLAAAADITPTCKTLGAQFRPYHERGDCSETYLPFNWDGIYFVRAQVPLMDLLAERPS